MGDISTAEIKESAKVVKLQEADVRGFGHIQDMLEHSGKPTPKKVFATPFKVVFKRPEDQSIVWLEVSSLDQLNGVASRVAGGVLHPINEMGTLDRQLWGHLAEYTGFLRTGGGSQFATGVAPFGAEKAELADDMAEIFGGVDPGLKALTDLRAQMMASQEARQPVEPVTSNDFVKEDGVNLTSAGEEALAKIVGESALDLCQNLTDELVRQSDPLPDEPEDAP